MGVSGEREMIRSSSRISGDRSAMSARTARSTPSLMRTGCGNGVSPRRCRSVICDRTLRRTRGLPPEVCAAVAAASSLIPPSTIRLARLIIVSRSSGGSSMVGMPASEPSSLT